MIKNTSTSVNDTCISPIAAPNTPITAMPILRNATVPSHLVMQEQITILVYFHEKAAEGMTGFGMQWVVKNNSPSQYALQNLHKKREASKPATTKTKARDETHHQVSSRNAL